MAHRRARRTAAVTVEVTGLRKSFGKVAALKGVSLSIRDGEFIALLGPSGSGKTSLLRMLAGLEAPDAGQIVFNGHPVNNVPARERGIGFVFQHYALFRHMTVARNVAFGLDIQPRGKRPSRSAIRARAQSLLDMMEIGDLADRYPDQISGGQRQRVALARALATEPRLLLLDEPFGALDAKVRKSLRVWLRELHDRLGLTSIFVTHDQGEAMEMADRVAVMRAGKVEQFDTPYRLHAGPANAFVHEFLGESIRFPCTVRDGFATIDDVPTAPIATECLPGPGIALIRPYEIKIEPGAGPARVISVHTLGPVCRIRVAIADRSLEIILDLKARVPIAGQSCNLGLSAAWIYRLTDPDPSPSKIT
jgi:sulfate transport system ATP-binding protein